MTLLKEGSVLIPNLMVAKSFWTVAKGLLGRSSLDEQSALWIWANGSIHTFFMKFSIDVVFVDKELQVKKIAPNVQPWRIVPRAWASHSVIEMAAGRAQTLGISVGDQLNVGD